MKIHILSPEVASQIAAGEVIERPASVVKELLENSLDAGASQITVQIEGAGKRLIEVADDGGGISTDDLPISVARHATSKLNTAQDLFNIKTLGFRGEALASIGSVSRMSITSYVKTESMGAKLTIEAGHIGDLKPFGSPEGTVVRVEDLFYNVPARLKFLKSDATERRQIDLVVTRYALAYPETRFKLIQDNRIVINTSGNGNRREVLASFYGVDLARQMLEAFYEDEFVQIKGYISPISITRSNRREITLFVNGRPIQDVALTSAVVQAYHSMLMVGRYPLAVLFILMDSKSVDVNVHPTKAEVRFDDPSRVFATTRQATRKALLAHTPIPGLDIQTEVNGADIDTLNSRQMPFSDSSPRGKALWGGELPVEVSREGGLDQEDKIRTPILRLVGQVAATYLVAEGPDGLYLIDQHAAHERVLYEKYRSLLSDRIPAQTLLQPATVQLTPPSARLIEEQLPILTKLGFDVEIFGPGTFLLRSLPVILAGIEPSSALRVLVDEFEEDETPLMAELEAKIIARVCKRAAIKAGQLLTHDEQQALLNDLEACQAPRTCPHGRPTMIHLSVDLLERQFGRRGAR